MPTQERVHEVLTNARAIMAERGLSKGWLEKSRTGNVCLRGAINIAAWGRSGSGGTVDWTTPGSEAHAMLLACEVAMGFDDDDPYSGTDGLTGAAYFNNYFMTTVEDVLARFDQGIAATASARELVPA